MERDEKIRFCLLAGHYSSHASCFSPSYREFLPESRHICRFKCLFLNNCALTGRAAVTQLPRLRCSFLCHIGSPQWATCSWRCQQQKQGCSHRNLALRTRCRPIFEHVLKASKSSKITSHSHQLLIKFPSLSLSPHDWCLMSLHSASLGAKHAMLHCFVCILASRS